MLSFLSRSPAASRQWISQETEELIYQLQHYWGDVSPQKGLDLGTGSGAIAIALTSLYPDLQMTAIDISISSLDLAMENAVANRVDRQIKFVHSLWFQKLYETFDFIISNPPYLSQKEVLYEKTKQKKHNK